MRKVMSFHCPTPTPLCLGGRALRLKDLVLGSIAYDTFTFSMKVVHEWHRLIIEMDNVSIISS
jgi:hypothetical protein